MHNALSYVRKEPMRVRRVVLLEQRDEPDHKRRAVDGVPWLAREEGAHSLAVPDGRMCG
jgi:hypothetical protein